MIESAVWASHNDSCMSVGLYVNRTVLFFLLELGFASIQRDNIGCSILRGLHKVLEINISCWWQTLPIFFFFFATTRLRMLCTEKVLKTPNESRTMNNSVEPKFVLPTFDTMRTSTILMNFYLYHEKSPMWYSLFCECQWCVHVCVCALHVGLWYRPLSACDTVLNSISTATTIVDFIQRQSIFIFDVLYPWSLENKARNSKFGLGFIRLDLLILNLTVDAILLQICTLCLG